MGAIRRKVRFETLQKESEIVRLAAEELSQYEIALRVGCSQQWVSRTIARAEQRIIDRNNEDARKIRQAAADRLEQVVTEAASAWARSVERPSIKTPFGDAKFLSVIVQAQVALNRLFGVEAPREVRVQGSDSDRQHQNEATEAQRQILADPTLRDLALQVELRQAELVAARRARSTHRGVWAQLASSPAEETGDDGGSEDQ